MSDQIQVISDVAVPDDDHFPMIGQSATGMILEGPWALFSAGTQILVPCEKCTY